MKRTRLIALIACLLYAGCTLPVGTGLALTPKAKVAAARVTLNTVLNTLATLREGGAFTKDEGKTLDKMVTLAVNIMDRWQAVVEVGQSPERSLISAYNMAIRELVTLRIQKERDDG